MTEEKSLPAPVPVQNSFEGHVIHQLASITAMLQGTNARLDTMNGRVAKVEAVTELHSQQFVQIQTVCATRTTKLEKLEVAVENHGRIVEQGKGSWHTLTLVAAIGGFIATVIGSIVEHFFSTPASK